MTRFRGQFEEDGGVGGDVFVLKFVVTRNVAFGTRLIPHSGLETRADLRIYVGKAVVSHTLFPPILREEQRGMEKRSPIISLGSELGRITLYERKSALLFDVLSCILLLETKKGFHTDDHQNSCLTEQRRETGRRGMPLRFGAPFLGNFRIVGTAGRSHDGSCFAAVFLRLFSELDVIRVLFCTESTVQGEKQS